MSAGPSLVAMPRPAYRNAPAFLAAMGEIGASGVLTRTWFGVRLDFRVPTERAHRAEVLIGDRSTWSEELWEDCTTLAVLLIPGGVAVLDQANDETHVIDFARLVAPRDVKPATVLRHRLGPADTGTPAALFRALRAIGGTVIVRRDRHGLGLGFAAPGYREVRLDLLLDACARHDGDFWLDAMTELHRLFPAAGSPWVMRAGEVRRLRLAEAEPRHAPRGRT